LSFEKTWRHLRHLLIASEELIELALLIQRDISRGQKNLKELQSTLLQAGYAIRQLNSEIISKYTQNIDPLKISSILRNLCTAEDTSIECSQLLEEQSSGNKELKDLRDEFLSIADAIRIVRQRLIEAIFTK